MPFDPDVAIVFGTLLSALVICLLYAVWYQSMKQKSQKRSARDDLANSVGLTELEDVIRKAVEEGVEPLHVRISSLERAVRTLPRAASGAVKGELTGRSEPIALDLSGDSTEVAEAEPERRTSVR